MGIQDWFRRKRGPKTLGKSKGGSALFTYSEDDVATPQIGFTDESTAEYVEEREKIYEELFGECDIVVHELLPLVPHIDVYRFPPNERRDFYTLATSGMSDLPMNAPDELGSEYRRVELIFYAAEIRDDYSQMLNWLAHFVHDANTWLHWNHTMPNGQPPEPFFGTENLDTMFFMPTIVEPDDSLGEKLQIQSEAVNFLWCVPITTAECQLKLDEGSEALYDLFDKNEHPFVFAGDRPSYA